MREQVQRVLAGIDDPEMPISIVDLGIVDDIAIEGDLVRICILPTFVGCPALDVLKSDIVSRVSAIPGVGRVEVSFVFSPAWTPARVSESGRQRLRGYGITVPEPGRAGSPALVPLFVQASLPCPFCAATDTRLQSPFGPTRCRMIYYCDKCGNTFEHIKDVGAATTVTPS